MEAALLLSSDFFFFLLHVRSEQTTIGIKVTFHQMEPTDTEVSAGGVLYLPALTTGQFSQQRLN